MPFKSHQVDEFKPGGLIFVTFWDFGFHLVKIRFYRLGFENIDYFGMTETYLNFRCCVDRFHQQNGSKSNK